MLDHPPESAPTLLQRLNSKEDLAVKPQKCAMEIENACCKGKGYSFAREGAYTRGELCSCVLTCPACLGKASKLINGTAHPCWRPSPRKVINIINDADLPARYVDAEFSNFKNFTGNCKERVESIHRWASCFKLGNQGMIISGPVGVGKTYLLACIVKEFARKGLNCRFVDFFQLINTIKGGYAEKTSDQSILAPLIDIDVLIIDELGKGRNSEFELTILDQLIMGRYNQDKIIVASTNYQIEGTYNQAMSRYRNLDLESAKEPQTDKRFNPEDFGHLESRVESRIFSRLKETTAFVTVNGDDFRRAKTLDVSGP